MHSPEHPTMTTDVLDQEPAPDDLSLSAWQAFQHWTGGRDVARFREAYIGHWPTRGEFGLHLAAEFGADRRLMTLPPWLRRYVQLDGEQITADFIGAGHFYVIDLPGNRGCHVFDGYG